MGEKAEVARQRPFADLESRRSWDPFRGLMSGFFEDWPQAWAEHPVIGAPRVDITETDDAYKVRAELPGVSRDDVTVELEQGVLCIRGEKKTRRDEKVERGRRLECSYGAFSRSFPLPKDADADRISAHFKDGVLDVSIAKSPESKPKQIAVKG